MSRFDSLNGTHPLTSNPSGREKRTGKIGGNGRGMGRGGTFVQVPPTQLGERAPARPQLPPPTRYGRENRPFTLMELAVTNPPTGVYRVGERVTGSFVCPACHTRTTTLVYQLPTSTVRWVCADWCSPRNPRTTPFVSTGVTNA